MMRMVIARSKRYLVTLSRIPLAIAFFVALTSLLFGFWYYRVRSTIWIDLLSRVYSIFPDTRIVSLFTILLDVGLIAIWWFGIAYGLSHLTPIEEL